ncbi:hypothetical protein ABE099_11995 [Paenibacillus turicensis]|uniref:hypothetical protein n=1 Tax=Paenibacillus turicensis TaxID=160487 RepID=UPI003D2DB652
MTSEELYDLLKKIKHRPGMYIGKKSIINLKVFLDGVLYAVYYMNEQNESTHFLQGFQEWIQIQYDISSSHHWSSILNFFSSDEAEAFDLFYKRLDEFLSLGEEASNYKNILKNKEKWMELKTEYWSQYDKMNF